MAQGSSSPSATPSCHSLPSSWAGWWHLGSRPVNGLLRLAAHRGGMGAGRPTEDASMRRRLTWGITALVTALALASPAQSETAIDRSPRTHVAGIDPRRLRRPSIERGAQARSGGERPAWQPHACRGFDGAGRGAARPDDPADAVRRRGRYRGCVPRGPHGRARGHPSSRGGERPHGVLRPSGGRAGSAQTTSLPRRPTARRCRRLRPEGVLRPVPAAVRPGVRLREQHAELPVRRRDPGGIGGRPGELVRAPHVRRSGAQQREAAGRLPDGRIHARTG